MSVDLDEVHHYYGIHGIERGGERGAVYELAIGRFEELARRVGIPLTFFVVGADARDAGRARQVRGLCDAGHEIANHSLEHRYDLTRLSVAEMRGQVVEGARAIEEAVGVAPVGFRAPGYVMTSELARVLEAAGGVYDSSVFPCPAYYLAKGVVLAGQRLGGRSSASLVDTPRVLRAPTEPYRMGREFHERGRGLFELPIQVTPGLRLPFIGTALTLGGERVARWLTRQVTGVSFVNLELHGLDLLDESDGLAALAPYQSDLRVPLWQKRRVLEGVIEQLKRAGYRFVRLDDAAAALGAAL